MKPEQFIREYGVEKARELLNADSDFKTYCLIDKSFWGESEGACSFCVDLDGVKRLVELLDFVQTYGGIVMAKRQLDLFLRVNLEQGTALSNTVSRLKDAVAVHESIYGGVHES